MQRAGRDFEELPPRGVPILSNENHFFRCRERDNADGARMNHDFARALVPGRLDHPILSNLDMSALISNSRMENFGFAHTMPLRLAALEASALAPS